MNDIPFGEPVDAARAPPAPTSTATPEDIPFGEPVGAADAAAAIPEDIPFGEPVEAPAAAPKPKTFGQELLSPTDVAKNNSLSEYLRSDVSQNKALADTLLHGWTTESLPAHLLSAYKKGVFNQPLSEIIKLGKDYVGGVWDNFHPADLFKQAAADPKQFAAGLIDAVSNDPELLLAGAGLGGGLTRAGAKLGAAGELAGAAAETGIAGGLVGTPLSAAQQLDEQGFIDPRKIATDFGTNATLGAALGGVLKLASLRSGASTPEITAAAQEFTAQGDSIAQAFRKAAEDAGVSTEDAAHMADALEQPTEATEEQPYRNEAADEAAAAKERIASGQATVGEEPSSLAARADFLDRKTTLTPSQARELQDIRTYQQVLPELGVEPQQAAAMSPSEAKAWVEHQLPEAPLDTAAKAEAPKLTAGELPQGMRERGMLDSDMARWAALTLGGAAIGGYLSDDKAEGALLGAAAALGGTLALKAGKRIVDSGVGKLAAVKAKWDSFKRDPAQAKQIDDILSAHQATISSAGLATDRLAYMLTKLVPDVARRSELIHAIQEGRVRELQGNERTAAELFQHEMASFGDMGQKAGVLDDLISDGSYVTQLWENEVGAKTYYSSMRGSSRFAEDRLIPSYKKGMELGLKPRTLDLAEIARIYGTSLGKAIGNKRILETLKVSKVVGSDTHVIMPVKDAPADYVGINHPQLMGYRVAPEMAPSLSFLFHSNNIPAWLASTTAISSAAKQGLLSLSGFHAKSLLEVGAGIALGLGSPKTLTRIPAMFKQLKQGKAGDFADQAVQAGLKIDAHGFDMDTHIAERVANKVVSTVERVPLAGKLAALPIKGVTAAAKGMNYFLWEYLHPSIKLATANVAFTKAMEHEAAQAIKDPAYKVRSPKQVMQEVATTTNDLFGGLDWRKVSGEIENRFLHQQVASLTNPEGLRLLRVGLLAPDWLASTIRAGYKGGKSTLKSLIPGTKLTVAEDLYRRYFLGGAVLTATVMEGLQQALTGTHFWDNEDPTTVVTADGRKVQVAKHYTEIFHWLRDPAATAVNKLGYVPKELIAQVANKQYVSTKGSPSMGQRKNAEGKLLPPSIGERLTHAVEGMLPIGAQNILEDKYTEALSGTLGVPIHGKTYEEIAAAKRKRAIEMSRRRARQRVPKREAR